MPPNRLRGDGRGVVVGRRRGRAMFVSSSEKRGPRRELLRRSGLLHDRLLPFRPGTRPPLPGVRDPRRRTRRGLLVPIAATPNPHPADELGNLPQANQPIRRRARDVHPASSNPSNGGPRSPRPGRLASGLVALFVDLSTIELGEPSAPTPSRFLSLGSPANVVERALRRRRRRGKRPAPRGPSSPSPTFGERGRPARNGASRSRSESSNFGRSNG